MKYVNELSTVETIEVSKKVGNKREKVGEVQVHIPTLADIDIIAADDSLVAAWVAKAIRAAALTEARNKLISGSAELKPGARIATTFEELATPAENSGEALREVSALKQEFAAYLATLGLSAKAQAVLGGLFGSPKSLALQPAGVREKMLARIEGFIEGATDGLTGAQERYLTRLADMDDSEDELDLDEL